MGRSRESYNKKEVRNKKEKKRKDKKKKREARKGEEKNSFNEMIAYVDKDGNISSEPPEEKDDEVKREDIEVSVPKKSESEKEDPIRNGLITFFNDNKGYGFIKDFKNGQSVFVHQNNAQDELDEGEQVSYEIEMGPRGLAAVNVKIIN